MNYPKEVPKNNQRIVKVKSPLLRTRTQMKIYLNNFQKNKLHKLIWKNKFQEFGYNIKIKSVLHGKILSFSIISYIGWLLIAIYKFLSQALIYLGYGVPVVTLILL